VPYLKNLEGYLQSASAIFSKSIASGDAAPQSGIYRCSSCGFEVVTVAGTRLPQENSCSDHDVRWKCRRVVVRWQLIAAPISVNG